MLDDKTKAAQQVSTKNARSSRALSHHPQVKQLQTLAVIMHEILISRFFCCSKISLHGNFSKNCDLYFRESCESKVQLQIERACLSKTSDLQGRPGPGYLDHRSDIVMHAALRLSPAKLQGFSDSNLIPMVNELVAGNAPSFGVYKINHSYLQKQQDRLEAQKKRERSQEHAGN